MATKYTLAYVVREARGRKLWTQDDLATHAHISLQTIRDIEQGVIKNYSLITLYKLEQTLGVPERYFVKKSEKEYKESLKGKEK